MSRFNGTRMGAQVEFGHSTLECVDLVKVDGCENGSQFVKSKVSPVDYGALLYALLDSVTGTHVEYVKERRTEFCDACFSSTDPVADCADCHEVEELVPRHTDCDGLSLKTAWKEYLAGAHEALVHLADTWPIPTITSEVLLNAFKKDVVAGCSDLLHIPVQETEGKTWMAVYSIARRELPAVLDLALGGIESSQYVVQQVAGKKRKFIRIGYKGATHDLDVYDTVLMWLNATRVLQGLAPFKAAVSWETVHLDEALHEAYEKLSRFLAARKARRSEHVQRIKAVAAELVETELAKIAAEAAAHTDRFRDVPKRAADIRRERKRLTKDAKSMFVADCASWHSFVKGTGVVSRGVSLVHRSQKLVVSFCEERVEIFRATVRARKEAERLAAEEAARAKAAAERKAAEEAARKAAEEERAARERASQPLTAANDDNWRARLVAPKPPVHPQSRPQSRPQPSGRADADRDWRRAGPSRRQESRPEPRQEQPRRQGAYVPPGARRTNPVRQQSRTADSDGDWRRSGPARRESPVRRQSRSADSDGDWRRAGSSRRSSPSGGGSSGKSKYVPPAMRRG